MSINQAVYLALSTILAEVYAVELPENPVWPSIVFDVNSTPESGWVTGGGYDQHIVNIVTLAKTLPEIETIKAQIDTAMQSIAGYMDDEERGDADYEPDPKVYGYFQNYRIRTRRA